MTLPSPAVIVLEDGVTFAGEALAGSGSVGGELVFNTSMAGYQEIATDPSYCGQLITYTFPMNGNYGADADRDESGKAHARAIIARELTNYRFNRASRQTWLDWLAEHGVLAVSGVDTRALTRHIRDAGRAARGREHGRAGRQAPAQGRPGTARDGRPRPGQGRHLRERVRGAGSRRGAGARPPRRRLRLRHQALDARLPRRVRVPRHRGARQHQRPEGAQAGAGRGVPQQRARRPGGRHLRRQGHRAPARQGARVRHLPRPPAPGAGARPQDLQAQVRPPRRQPPGQGPAHRRHRDHDPEPRVRGAGRGRPRRRDHPRQPERRHRRRRRGAAASSRSRCSTTPSPRRGRTTRSTCSTGSATRSTGSSGEGRPDAAPRRPPQDPDHRLRAHRHRAGLRVRLLRHAGLQGAARRGLRGRARQQQPGDDHDRPRVRDADVHRAARPRHAHAHHRGRAPGRPAAHARRADGAQPGHGAQGRRGARPLGGRDDRRRREGHPPRRGPPRVPHRHGRDRPAHAAQHAGRDHGRGREPPARSSASRSSSAPPTRSAAAAAASPTTTTASCASASRG